MAWYNNLGDLGGDLKAIATGHNPMNHPTPVPAPAPGPTSVPGLPMGRPGTGQQTLGSTEPVYPNFSIPGDDTGGGIDIGSILGKIPGWVLDGIKTGLPEALSWLKDNSSSLLQGATLADAAYRQVQADKYASAAIKSAQGAYDAKAPLRAAGIQGMLSAGAANPFAKGALPLAANPSPNPGVPTPVTQGGGNPALPGGIPWHTGAMPGSPPIRDPRRVALPMAPGV